MTRTRLDQELVSRRLLPSRSSARIAILDGLVRVDGDVAEKPAMKVSPLSAIEVEPDAARYVGRGARKLAAALSAFEVSVAGRTAVDVGSSTGGFTEVLLEAGAERVVAVDVGHDQLDPRLRSDPRVVVREGTNVREVTVTELGGPFDVVTVDLSFISLGVVADALMSLGNDGADWVVLVKPQFEVGQQGLGKGGVVRSEDARKAAIQDVAALLEGVGLLTVGAMESPISGGSGNREALLWLRRTGTPITVDNLFKVDHDV
ncbi:MAG: TlyA family RNA methyltransferase [bacterium]|nr:TlyA family RNA methyltransferase [bacterium]MCP4968822.1 TlyA family RNA methyltransferase [bacterium]